MKKSNRTTRKPGRKSTRTAGRHRSSAARRFRHLGFAWRIALPFIAIASLIAIGVGALLTSRTANAGNNRSRPDVATIVFVERSEEHTSELQSQSNLVCRLLLEKKKKKNKNKEYNNE